MKIRTVYMALPAFALGIACSTTGNRTARSPEPPDRGSATAEASAGTAGDVRGHASDQVISGRVAEASGGSLVVESAAGERRTLSLVDQTVVTIDGREGHASELQPGQDVLASFDQVDGRDVAVKVDASQGTSSGGGYAPGSPGSPPDATSPDQRSRNEPPASGARPEDGSGLR